MNADLAMQRTLDRFGKVGFDGLSEAEKTLACVWFFESKVANGGLERFFGSSAGDLAGSMPGAFRAVGAETRGEIAERANAVFGPGGVPTDRERRKDILKSLPAEARRVFDELELRYFEATKDLDDRLERYLTRERGVVR